MFWEERFDFTRSHIKEEATHLRGFTNKDDAPHQGADGHLEEVTFTQVICDAVEFVHHQ